MFKKRIIATILGSALLATLAVAVMAQENLTQPARAQKKQLDIACMKTAVEKRESAIIAAWDIFSASVKSALETRKSELLVAWGTADNAQRRAAIQAAWKKFKESRISARKTLNATRLSAWQQFTVDRKACGSGPTGENSATDMAL